MGTRPEAVKLLPVRNALISLGTHKLVTVWTGQHGQQGLDFLHDLEWRPDYTFAPNLRTSSLVGEAARILRDLSDVLDIAQANQVLVQGDTMTAGMGGLAAFLTRRQVHHVEAGLRSGCLTDPFPEEGIRRMISATATTHYAPTKEAVSNLLGSGVPPDVIHLVGNPVVDALEAVTPRLEFPGTNGWLVKEVEGYERLAAVTLHRRELHGGVISEVAETLVQVARSFGHWLLVLPVHQNPRVADALWAIRGQSPNLRLIEALPYIEFLQLLRNSDAVITDSGGVLEEAVTLARPTVVVRDNTERPEALMSGLATLSGKDPRAVHMAIVSAFKRAESSVPARLRAQEALNRTFGDGRAGRRIASIVADSSPRST